jgi:hypothetical protein
VNHRSMTIVDIFEQSRIQEEAENAELGVAAATEMRVRSYAQIQEHMEKRRALEQQEREEREERDRFFNQPSASADFAFWCRLPLLSADETVALSLGKAPEIVTRENVEPLRQVSPFAFAYMRLSEHVNRAVLAKELDNPTSPAAVVSWMTMAGVEIPPEFKAQVIEVSQLPDWRTRYDEAKSELLKQQTELQALRKECADLRELAASPELKTRERNSLLDMVRGLVVAAYKYDGAASRNSIAREIAEDTMRAGRPVSEDTVRKWVRQAFSQPMKGS